MHPVINLSEIDVDIHLFVKYHRVYERIIKYCYEAIRKFLDIRGNRVSKDDILIIYSNTDESMFDEILEKSISEFVGGLNLPPKIKIFL